MRNTILLLLAGFILLSENVMAAGNSTNDSFNKAKKMLERQVYFDHRITIYCGAEFDAKKNIALPEGFKTPAHDGRSKRVEWEHAVPAENFGRTFREWREGDPQCIDNSGTPFKGRKCAEKANLEYRYMQSDMYNLFPAIGSVNAVRSNKQYSELQGGEVFGTCPAKMEGSRFEPPDTAKGQVARAAFYMQENYPRYRISRQQVRLFEAWDRLFPVDKWECVRASRIEKLQGNANRFVKDPCVNAGLWR